jgi:succinate dehydrogenase / fumarate reductase flavoprotein subunit
VDDRDNWKVHFTDTMRGGQYLNNWRMVELHAKEAPERVKGTGSMGSIVRSHQRWKDTATEFWWT